MRFCRHSLFAVNRRAALFLIAMVVASGLAPVGRPQINGIGTGVKAAAGHWAFQKPALPPLPPVQKPDWAINPIDRFILARLEKESLAPSPEADRVTLIRRVTFDLTGLPPRPEEVASFLADTSPEAYDKVVDRLLASPRYGERWGRQWLDLAGYADSNGYFDADSERPFAWKYRDYVIAALNEDKPFNLFIVEQLGGDELAHYQPGGDVTPEMAPLLVATHLLRNPPDGTGESDGNAQELRADRYAVLEGNVQMLGSIFLGLTVQCARCHDHKFEPVTQEEYYQLQAILKPIYNHDQWLKPAERVISVGSRLERQQNRKEIEKSQGELKALKDSYEGLWQPLRKRLVEENLEGLDPALRARILKAWETKEKERTEEMKALLKEHQAGTDLKEPDVLKRFPQLREAVEQLKSLIAAEEKAAPKPLPQIAAATEVTNDPPAHAVLKRGDYGSPIRAANPGVPRILVSPDCGYEIEAGDRSRATSGRRLAFARWVTSTNHPVFARLTVNRIWQNHFGQGLVRTADNFGVTGARPTHPELLDYLAVNFMNSGWRLKRLHRLIVSSRAYRQASGLREEAYRHDRDNDWLWRYPVRRLEAESVRDAMLAISGEIDWQIGGPPVPCERNEEGQIVVNEQTPGSHRRSIYLQQRRTALPAALEVFDFPQMNPNCTQRNASTVSLQSLYLLNSDFARKRSARLAERLTREQGENSEARLQSAFQLVFSRPPGSAEKQAAEDFLASARGRYGSDSGAEGKVWADFCQMLLASNGFLYLD